MAKSVSTDLGKGDEVRDWVKTLDPRKRMTFTTRQGATLPPAQKSPAI